ncbi:hypothetical protein HOP50_20g85380 [Chloropicon primus]|nr:hypothetical protein HOP50_20g85380 [Chloropicon primus]
MGEHSVAVVCLGLALGLLLLPSQGLAGQKPEALFRKPLSFPFSSTVRTRENLVENFGVNSGYDRCTSLDGPSCPHEEQGLSVGELDGSIHLLHVAELKITEASNALLGLVMGAALDGNNANLREGDSQAIKELVADLLQTDDFIDSIQKGTSELMDLFEEEGE